MMTIKYRYKDQNKYINRQKEIMINSDGHVGRFKHKQRYNKLKFKQR